MGPTEQVASQDGEREQALGLLLRERIRREGRITFAEFMETVLYHPVHGYYCADREPIGPRGDYYTSLEVHPLFGETITRQLLQMWQVMGCPDRFDVVEMGAGKGLLCHDVLAAAPALDASFAGAVQYHIVEPVPSLVEWQRKILSLTPAVQAISWHASLADLAHLSDASDLDSPSHIPVEGAARPTGMQDVLVSRAPRRSGHQYKPVSSARVEGLQGCILSNELIDAFPVHQVIWQEGSLHECYVTLRDGELAEALGPPSTPALARYFHNAGIALAEEQRAEVNLRAIEWMRQVGQVLGRGFVLTIDYGYPAPELYGPRHHRGSLLCYHQHRVSENPFERLGRQDITAHVDFSALMRAGEDAGLSVAGLITQMRFLLGLGIMERGEELIARPGMTLQEALDVKRAIACLIDPEGLGKFRVLIQSKSITPLPTLSGLSLRPRNRET